MAISRVLDAFYTGGRVCVTRDGTHVLTAADGVVRVTSVVNSALE